MATCRPQVPAKSPNAALVHLKFTKMAEKGGKAT
jgi:hypothetical protein